MDFRRGGRYAPASLPERNSPQRPVSGAAAAEDPGDYIVHDGKRVSVRKHPTDFSVMVPPGIASGAHHVAAAGAAGKSPRLP